MSDKSNETKETIDSDSTTELADDDEEDVAGAGKVFGSTEDLNNLALVTICVIDDARVLDYRLRVNIRRNKNRYRAMTTVRKLIELQ
jgi:hypothetical protein